MNGWQIFVEVPGHAPVELKPGESIIGRSRTAQVHVPDSTVSRQHARLLVGGFGDVGVEDLGSSNGTYVNGEKIEGRRRLQDGDKVLIGDAELRLRIAAPVAAAEATVRMVLPPLGPPPAAPAPPPAPATPPPPAWSAPDAASSPRVTAPFPPQPGAPPPPPSWAAAAEPARSATPPPPPPPPPPAAAPVAPPPSWAAAPAPVPAAPAPAPRPIDPPLRIEPRAAAAAPAPAPSPAAPSAAPQAPVYSPPPARRDVLPSVTVIDRIPIPEPTAEALEASRLARARPAGFWLRVVAALVDYAVVGIVAVALSALFALVGMVAPGSGELKMALISGFVAVLGILYPIVFWALRGATPGKMLLHLAVVRTGVKPGSGIGWGAAIVRGLGYVASGVLFGIGFLLVAFTSQKQGLHDLIAGTRVLKLR